METIKVIVAGPVNCGRTTIIKHLCDTLKEHGVEVDVSDTHYDELKYRDEHPEMQAQVLKNLKKVSKVEIIETVLKRRWQ